MNLKILESSGFQKSEKEKLERVAFCVLKKLNFLYQKKKLSLPFNPNLNLAFSLYNISVAKMQKINFLLFKKEKPTTVISLPSFLEPIQNYHYLGDIYLCKEEAKKESFLTEALLIHSLIHLFGFDHHKNSKTFEKLEEEFLDCLKKTRKSKECYNF